MKEFPKSWKKLANKQLSFESELYYKPSREDLFVDTCIAVFMNLKWLRYRSKYSKMTILEKLIVYENLGLVLDQAAILLYRMTRDSQKHKDKKLTDFVYMIYEQRADNGLAEEVTRRALLEHHDNVSGRIHGIFLAYNDILGEYKPITSKLLGFLELSHNAVKRLNHAI